MNHLFCFGMGFSARHLAARLAQQGWRITGTSRSAEGAATIRGHGFHAAVFKDAALPVDALQTVTHVVVSAPPGPIGDPVLAGATAALRAQAAQIRWLGYLSTTGVYGNRRGDWVTEESPLTPDTERGQRRLAAEMAWLEFGAATGIPVQLFRLAGIYGPGRNQLLSVLEGSARRIIKPGQVFSRIHVEDIATVLYASIGRPTPGRAYNVCDDEPCPPEEVVAYAAQLLGLPLPPAVPFEVADLSPMARSFYADSKRVSNRRIKEELGVNLAHPTFREGLAALLKDIKR